MPPYMKLAVLSFHLPLMSLSFLNAIVLVGGWSLSEKWNVPALGSSVRMNLVILFSLAYSLAASSAAVLVVYGVLIILPPWGLGRVLTSPLLLAQFLLLDHFGAIFYFHRGLSMLTYVYNYRNHLTS